MIGWSGTNMRYVTITKSQFWNNGTGIVPNALDSEKFPPAEDNVISNNQVFWNNFDYYKGAPFKLGDTKVGGSPTRLPDGVGILLLRRAQHRREQRGLRELAHGHRRARRRSRSRSPQLATLIGNTVRGNAFGADGTDLNGYDLYYDGDGSGNCFGPNTGVSR